MPTDIQLIAIFRELLQESGLGCEKSSVEMLPESGSNRRYARIQSGGRCFIATYGPDRDENEAFLSLTAHFTKSHLPVPEVLHVSKDRLSYLQEDLGHDVLFDMIKSGRTSGEFSPEEVRLLEKTISILPHFQFKDFQDIDLDACYPMREFGSECIMWDLNYFKYMFLRPLGIIFREDRLEEDFTRLRDRILASNTQRSFMIRDFQSRNVMIKDGEPYLIDYQGGRQGAFYYDVASFLFQARAGLTEDLREHLIDVYLEGLKQYVSISRKEFRSTLDLFVLLRSLQVLGAYGLRGLIERKVHFIESIPPALDNISRLMERMDLGDLPTLRSVLESCLTLERFKRKPEPKRLVVEVTSFGFKKGLPEERSGNGGGFIFDCRALNNPGRYQEYKKLTGRDQEVISFLEERSLIADFLEDAYHMVDRSVDNYLERDFRHLQVNFGCTGGHHRSVYSAEHMTEHLLEKYDVDVHLIHRELGIDRYFTSRKSQDV